MAEIRDGKSLIFLDLEKAFERASPEAILSTLANKGIEGRLLGWLGDFFRDREALVRFQGHSSTPHKHINGTPQGSIISPTLYNTLMDTLMLTTLL